MDIKYLNVAEKRVVRIGFKLGKLEDLISAVFVAQRYFEKGAKVILKPVQGNEQMTIPYEQMIEENWPDVPELIQTRLFALFNDLQHPH